VKPNLKKAITEISSGAMSTQCPECDARSLDKPENKTPQSEYINREIKKIPGAHEANYAQVNPVHQPTSTWTGPIIPYICPGCSKKMLKGFGGPPKTPKPPNP